MSPSQTRGEPRSWLWISLFWLALGIFDGSQTVAQMRAQGMHHDWARLFAVSVMGWLPWIPATLLILRLERRLPIADRGWSRWLVHGGAVVFIALAESAWTSFLQVRLNPTGDTSPNAFMPLWIDTLYASVLSTTVLYAVVLLAYHTIGARAREAARAAELARLNERLAQVQLSALRQQVEPHFLFNALNSIAGLIRDEQPDAAVEMVIALSDFLRRTLTTAARQEVRLSEEIEFARQYLAIQRVRFADRLRFDIEVPADLAAAAVPNLILQPLVENAVVHGIAKRMQPGAIRIVAVRDGGALIVRVANDGPALAPQRTVAGRGIGIANVRDRLRGLYGNASAFELRDATAGGVEASITIPLRPLADVPAPA